MEQTTLPIPTSQGLKNEFSIGLAKTEQSFQKLQTEADSLVYNEDNLAVISSFLDKTNEIRKAAKKYHKDGKEYFLQGGRVWDAFLKDIEGILSGIESIPQSKYKNIILEISERQKKQKEERERWEKIEKGINANYQDFAAKISATESIEDLNKIERLINLEKGKKEKYGDMHEKAVEKYNLLNENLKLKKEGLKMAVKPAEAEKKTDDYETKFEIMQQQSEVLKSIKETNVTVLTESINGISNAYAEEVLPDVPKAKYSKWMFDASNADFNFLRKKFPIFVKEVIDEANVEAYLKNEKEKGLGNKEEFFIGGIRFYLHKKY